MNIGIIGAGRMGKALCAIWVQHHQLMLSYGRDQHRLQVTARELGPGVSVGTPAQAAQFGDVIVLTVRWPACARRACTGWPYGRKIIVKYNHSH